LFVDCRAVRREWYGCDLVSGEVDAEVGAVLDDFVEVFAAVGVVVVMVRRDRGAPPAFADRATLWRKARSGGHLIALRAWRRCGAW
jgi:hypothetical protein